MKWFGRKEENYPHEKNWEKTSFTSHFKKRYFSIPLWHIFYFEWEILIPSQSRERGSSLLFLSSPSFLTKSYFLNIFFGYYSFTPRCWLAGSAFVLFSFSIKGKNIERRAAAHFTLNVFFSVSQWKQKQLCGMISLFILYLSLSPSHTLTS